MHLHGVACCSGQFPITPAATRGHISEKWTALHMCRYNRPMCSLLLHLTLNCLSSVHAAAVPSHYEVDAAMLVPAPTLHMLLPSQLEERQVKAWPRVTVAERLLMNHTEVAALSALMQNNYTTTQPARRAGGVRGPLHRICMLLMLLLLLLVYPEVATISMPRCGSWCFCQYWHQQKQCYSSSSNTTTILGEGPRQPRRSS